MDGSYRRTRQQSIGRYLYRYGLPTIVRVRTPCLDNRNPSGSQHHYESGHHRITSARATYLFVPVSITIYVYTYLCSRATSDLASTCTPCGNIHPAD